MEAALIIGLTALGAALVLLVLFRDKTPRRAPQRKSAQSRRLDGVVAIASRDYTYSAMPLGKGVFGMSKGARMIAQPPPLEGAKPYIQPGETHLSNSIKHWEEQDREYRRRHGLKEDGSDDPRFAGPSAGETVPRNWPSLAPRIWARQQMQEADIIRAARNGMVGSAAHVRGAEGDDNALGFAMAVTTGVPIPLNAGSIAGVAIHHANQQALNAHDSSRSTSSHESSHVSSDSGSSSGSSSGDSGSF